MAEDSDKKAAYGSNYGKHEATTLSAKDAATFACLLVEAFPVLERAQASKDFEQVDKRNAG